MWHQGYMDPLLDQLIANLVIFENVNLPRLPDGIFRGR